MADSTPYTVIGGFLGAGKTTLLNALLSTLNERQLAILVNDFGEINLDADLIAAHEGETIRLANGCICCSLASGFASALAALERASTPFDHIIVEASGVSDPLRVGDLGVRAQLTLDSIVVVTDAAQLCTLAENVYVGELILGQLKAADLLILNKVDLVSARQLDAARTLLHAAAPDTPVVETVYGRVPAALLLGFGSERLTRRSVHPSDVDQHDHAKTYATYSFTADTPISKSELVAWIDALPATVLRAKGLLYLADDPARAFLLQLVGRRWHITPAAPWAERMPSSRLLVIGLPQTPAGDAALPVISPF